MKLVTLMVRDDSGGDYRPPDDRRYHAEYVHPDELRRVWQVGDSTWVLLLTRDDPEDYAPIEVDGTPGHVAALFALAYRQDVVKDLS